MKWIKAENEKSEILHALQKAERFIIWYRGFAMEDEIKVSDRALTHKPSDYDVLAQIQDAIKKTNAIINRETSIEKQPQMIDTVLHDYQGDY